MSIQLYFINMFSDGRAVLLAISSSSSNSPMKGSEYVPILWHAHYDFVFSNTLFLEMRSSLIPSVVFNQDNLLQTFPNPSKDYINFNLLALDNNLVSLQLFDTFGKEIKKVTFSGPVQSYKLSVKDLTSGLFLAFIRTDQGLYSRKVFIH